VSDNNEPTPPTCEQLFKRDGFTKVSDEVVEPWRWGTVHETIYRRTSDETFWSACYRVGNEGETHELRDGGASITRVYPRSKVVTVYTTTPEQPANGAT
jgi:hypothetical protein